MASRALAVAVTAAVLLVVVVAADASMNRYVHLEAHVEGRWIKVATEPPEHMGRAVPGYVAFDLNASDVVPMRLRVENGHPWGFSEPAEVSLGSRLVHAGTLAAGARSEGVLEFNVNASQLLASDPRGPVPHEPDAQAYAHPWFEVRVGERWFGGALAFREVSRG